MIVQDFLFRKCHQDICRGFICMFCWSLFVLLYFFFWLLCWSFLLRYTDSDCPYGIGTVEQESSSSSLVEIPKEHKTDLWLSRISSFVSVIRVYVGLPNDTYLIPSSNSLCNVIYTLNDIERYIAGSRVGVTQMWILRKSKDLLEYIHSRSSPHAIALKHLTSLPSTQLFLHSKLNNKLK
jgi:hypothetical protein